MKKSLCTSLVVLFFMIMMGMLNAKNISNAVTISPTPTINFEDICVFPCWNNIIPNQTTWLEAQQNLEALEFPISSAFTESNTNLTAYLVGVNSFDIKALEEGTLDDRSGSLQATVLLKEDVVYSVWLRFGYLGNYLEETDANQQTWNLIEPSGFIAMYGKPDYFLVNVDFVSEGIAVATNLFWPEEGISLTYIFRRLAQEGDLCWNLDDIDAATLRLYEPNNRELFEENIEKTFRVEITGESDFEVVANAQTEEAFLDLIRNEGCMSIRLQPETPVKEFNFDFGW